MSNLKENIISALREVYDPEIPINVYDLGLIYEINVRNEGDVEIVMTLTSPACPTADYIKEMIEDAARSVDGVSNVDIELTFEPMWSPDKVSVEVREELGMSSESVDDLVLNEVYGEKDVQIGEEKICFNCSISEKKVPLLSCRFKGEDMFVCSKCLSKF